MRTRVDCFSALALGLLCACSAAAQAPLLTWTSEAVVLESDFSSWARMVQLPDGSWLAAYSLTATPSRIRVKRSTDNMRTWSWVTEIGEDGRDLDNPALCLRPDGSVLLALRSAIYGQSYYIETYQSSDGGNSFQYQSQVDWDHGAGGVYEPYLYALPDGTILCFYASETHRNEIPAYSQTLSEKVSLDGGLTWGPEILAIAESGAARAGEGNIVRISGTVLALFYEMCGTENCIGHVSYSSDGVTWPEAGAALPDTFQDVQAVGLQNGLIFATSNLARVIVSADFGNTWKATPEWPFAHGVWPALYQTGPNEIAMVMTGAGEHGEAGEYIRFGTVHMDALQSTAPISSCRQPTLTRPQNCF